MRAKEKKKIIDALRSIEHYGKCEKPFCPETAVYEKSIMTYDAFVTLYPFLNMMVEKEFTMGNGNKIHIRGNGFTTGFVIKNKEIVETRFLNYPEFEDAVIAILSACKMTKYEDLIGGAEYEERFI